MLRAAKDPSATEGGWDCLGYVCRQGVADLRATTELTARVDVVVSVPSRRARFQRRGMSLPDLIARAVHEHLGISYEPDALVSMADNLEVKKIAIERRYEVVRDAFGIGPGDVIGKSVLLIEDITTSGATPGLIGLANGFVNC